MRQKLADMTGDLERDLAISRGETADALQRKGRQLERAEAAEAALLIAEETQRVAERLQAEAEKALKAETNLRERTEQKLETEMRNAVPLRAQANALPGARTEAAQAQALANRRQVELANAQEAQARLLLEALKAETGTKALLKEVGPLEQALNNAMEDWTVTCDERDDLIKELAEHKAQAAKEAELDLLR